jgi:protein SCO1/2
MPMQCDRRRPALVMIAVLTVLSLYAGCMSAAAAPVRIAPDFTLSDQTGRQFTLSHYRGRPVVLFFGYTHCPDVCPTILANLKRARDVLGVKAHDVVVALVTVDPERDTAAELRQFVTVFDPSFLGLRGTRKQLEPIYRAYHVRYAKLAENASGYLVSHTAFVYYIGRDGRFSGYGTWSDPQQTLQEDLRDIVDDAHR